VSSYLLRQIATARSMREFMQPRADEIRKGPPAIGMKPSEKVLEQVEIMVAYLKEHGPSKTREVGAAIGVKWNQMVSIINAAGEYYPVWQEDGVIGVLGYGDEGEL
jgi:hypothetical protein